MSQIEFPGSPKIGSESRTIRDIRAAYQLSHTISPPDKTRDYRPNERLFREEAETPQARLDSLCIYSDLAVFAETYVEQLGLSPTPEQIREAYQGSIATRTVQRREKGINTPFPIVDPNHLIGSGYRYQAWFEHRLAFEEEPINELSKFIETNQMLQDLIVRAFDLRVPNPSTE